MRRSAPLFFKMHVALSLLSYFQEYLLFPFQPLNIYMRKRLKEPCAGSRLEGRGGRLSFGKLPLIATTWITVGMPLLYECPWQFPVAVGMPAVEKLPRSPTVVENFCIENGESFFSSSSAYVLISLFLLHFTFCQ
ncbi:hypothetical protein Tcan_00228 [Toxocara canis]|uniref:Uncharacterized protein n=1 Tax=Toxocara canis TaxID=6265 RepID=A0A0B2VMK7_TOXCA|nr:hypothetical protein Tcan_00228 [Toxocara canis]